LTQFAFADGIIFKTSLHLLSNDYLAWMGGWDLATVIPRKMFNLTGQHTLSESDKRKQSIGKVSLCNKRHTKVKLCRTQLYWSFTNASTLGCL
jgi:hypothetical protein